MTAERDPFINNDTVRYKSGLSFPTSDGTILLLRHPKHRPGERESITSDDFDVFRYSFPQTDEEIKENRRLSANLARERLAEYKKGNSKPMATGVEIEGVVYAKKDFSLMPVYDNRFPPERFDAQIEVVTGKTKEGHLPSSAVEVAVAIAEAAKQAYDFAEERDALVVFSSIPEAGDPSQLRLTDSPKILEAYRRGQTGIHKDTPAEVREICEKAEVTDIIPFMGTHIHTSNHRLPNGLYDSNEAYVAGLLATTQMAHVESFMLANTKHLLGKRINARDGRALIRRTTAGAHKTEMPDTSYDFIYNSLIAFKNGETHDVSRLPGGAHDRTRPMRSFGSREYVYGSAPSDLRVQLAHTYYIGLLGVLGDIGLDATSGDESRVLSYLQNDFEKRKYPHLVTKIPTMEGENNCYEQDLKFRDQGFDAKALGKTYREQYQEMREIARKIGKEFPAFKTQAAVVDHVFGAVVAKPDGATIEEYLDITSGMNGGTLSDYESDDIEKNTRAKSEGVKKQAKILLELCQEKGEKGILEFVGAKEPKSITIYSA